MNTSTAVELISERCPVLPEGRCRVVSEENWGLELRTRADRRRRSLALFSDWYSAHKSSQIWNRTWISSKSTVGLVTTNHLTLYTMQTVSRLYVRRQHIFMHMILVCHRCRHLDICNIHAYACVERQEKIRLLDTRHEWKTQHQTCILLWEEVSQVLVQSVRDQSRI